MISWPASRPSGNRHKFVQMRGHRQANPLILAFSPKGEKGLAPGGCRRRKVCGASGLIIPQSSLSPIVINLLLLFTCSGSGHDLIKYIVSPSILMQYITVKLQQERVA